MKKKRRRVEATEVAAAAPRKVRRAPSAAGGSRAERLRRSGVWLLAWLLLLAGIVAVRWEIVDSPPYYDYVIGLWAEADFLAHSGFDYRALLYEHGHTLDTGGGPRSYMTSVLPTLAAAMLMVAPEPRQAMVAYHLFVFACAAAAVLLFFAQVRPITGTVLAVLLAAAVVTTPVFCTQIDMLGFELPLVVCGLLATGAMGRERYVAAASWGLAAFLIKPTGAILLMANVVYLGGLWLLGTRQQAAVARRRLWWGIVVSATALAVAAMLLLWGDSFGRLVRPKTRPFWFLVLYFVPDLGLWFGLLWLFAAMLALLWYRRRRRETSGGRSHFSLRSDLSAWVRRYPEVTYAIVVLAGILLALRVVFFVPRYLTLAVPFFYLIVAAVLVARPRVKWVGGSLIGVIVVLNVVNWNGQLFPSQMQMLALLHDDLAIWLGREGSHLERSHEYLAEHKSNIRAMQFLEEQCADRPIVAGHPYQYFASSANMGYVERPLAGYSSTPFGNAPERFRDATWLPVDAPADAVFVWAGNGFCTNLATFRIPLPNVDAGDRVLWDDEQPSPLLIYEKTWPAGDAQREDWYLAHLWPDPWRLWPDLPLAERLGVLLDLGLVEEALDEAARAAAVDPRHTELTVLVRALEALSGHLRQTASQVFEQAEAQAAALEQETNLSGMQYRSRDDMESEIAKRAVGPWPALQTGLIWLKYGARHQAAEWFVRQLEVERDLARRYPRLYPTDRGLAAALDGLDQTRSPALALPEAVRWRPVAWAANAADEAWAHAVFAIESGELGTAEAALDDAVAAGIDRRRAAAARVVQGILALERGRLAEARSWLEAARGLDPAWPEAHNYLGVVALLEDRPTTAIESFRTAARLAPEYVDAHYNLALTLARQGQHAEALAELHRAQQLMRSDDRARQRLADEVAGVLGGLL